jgi:dolichol-phosphate mannosyltransferase
MTFTASPSSATVVVMTSTYLLDNPFTFRDRRLGGWPLAKGWVTFSLACGAGAIANVGISSYIFNAHVVGWAPAALSGVMIVSMWNCAVSSVLTWRTTA